MTIKKRNGRVIHVDGDEEALAIIEIIDVANEHIDLSQYPAAKAARIEDVIQTIRTDLG